MNTPTVSWYKASDDSAATGLNVDIHTQWFRCGPRDRPSFQALTAAGITCAYKLQFTNQDMRADPTITPTMVNDYPTGAIPYSPTQPAGAGATTMICVESIGEWYRAYSTASAGGSGVLPTAKVSFTELVDD